MDSLNFKDMKNYTIIPNYASGKFSPNDLYTITGIYLTANDKYITDSTYEQIASSTGQSLSYIKVLHSNSIIHNRKFKKKKILPTQTY